MFEAPIYIYVYVYILYIYIYTYVDMYIYIYTRLSENGVPHTMTKIVGTNSPSKFWAPDNYLDQTGQLSTQKLEKTKQRLCQIGNRYPKIAG